MIGARVRALDRSVKNAPGGRTEGPRREGSGRQRPKRGPDAARTLETKLRAMGKDVTFTVHPGTGHAFMGPHNALGTLDEGLAAQLWPEVISFLHEQLG
jgi:dienelactone hydrolase